MGWVMRWVTLVAIAWSIGCRYRDSDPRGFRVVHEMVPMRDGVRLDTYVLIPDGDVPLGILFARTPYDYLKPEQFTAPPHYILMGQNIRGRIHSEGKFEMVRPPRD